MSRVVCEASPEKTQKQVDRCYDKLEEIQNRREPFFDYFKMFEETEESYGSFLVIWDSEAKEYGVAQKVYMNPEDFYLKIATTRNAREVIREYDAFKQNLVNDLETELEKYGEIIPEDEREEIIRKLEKDLEDSKKDLEKKIEEKEREKQRESKEHEHRLLQRRISWKALRKWKIS